MNANGTKEYFFSSDWTYPWSLSLIFIMGEKIVKIFTTLYCPLSKVVFKYEEKHTGFGNICSLYRSLERHSWHRAPFQSPYCVRGGSSQPVQKKERVANLTCGFNSCRTIFFDTGTLDIINKLVRWLQHYIFLVPFRKVISNKCRGTLTGWKTNYF